MVLVAAMAQTLRNATQSHLTALIGTMGATQVRFLYGLPFALVFFAGVIAVTGEPIPGLTAQALGFTAFGALAQIAATALMLSAMKDARFALATALIKTEPIVVAILAFVLIGDALTPLKLLAIAIATAGVLIISMPFGSKAIDRLDPRIIALAVTAGLGFGLAAIGFRGGVLALEGGSFVMRATTILVVSLAIQSAVLGLYLAIADRAALTGSLAHARASLVSGFLGALASQFWFLGFALTTAANVRTLALVEVLIAMAVSRKLFRERLSLRQSLGIAIMLAGVGLLIVSAA
jgi:drug/metabolite transporter (DMT)-like permease